MQTSLFPVGIIMKNDTDFDLIEFINGRTAITKSGKRVKFIALLSDESTQYPLVVEIAGNLVNYTKAGLTCMVDEEDYTLCFVDYSSFRHNEVSPTVGYYRMNPKTKEVESRWKGVAYKNDNISENLSVSSFIWN